MNEAFAQGWIVDFILALVAAEGIVLSVICVKRGRALLAPGLVANLLAGAFLLLALRCALRGVDWRWIALCLISALLAHAVDMAERWRR